MASDEQSMPFIRNLASSDRKIRTSALETLRTFLSASARTRKLTAVDNLKLWKGLFYSLWMCDRPIPQQNLCAELAGLLDTISTSASYARSDKYGEGGEHDMVIGWLEGFWQTMAREWTSIDVLRMEKFLLLVRRVFAASLAWAIAAPAASSEGGRKKKNSSKNGANSTEKSRSRQDAMIKLFSEWPLEVTGDISKVAVGLRLHVLDIWVDEAEKVGLVVADTKASKEDDDEDEEDEEKEEAAKTDASKDTYFLERIRDLVEAQHKSPSKPVRARAKESLADERLPWNEAAEEEEEEENDSGSDDGDAEDGWGGFDD